MDFYLSALAWNRHLDQRRRAEDLTHGRAHRAHLAVRRGGDHHVRAAIGRRLEALGVWLQSGTSHRPAGIAQP